MSAIYHSFFTLNSTAQSTNTKNVSLQIRRRLRYLIFAIGNSVTRFGEKLSLTEIFWMVYFEFDKLLCLLCYFYATGQIFIAVNDQRVINNLAIWSHCLGLNLEPKSKVLFGILIDPLIWALNCEKY